MQPGFNVTLPVGGAGADGYVLRLGAAERSPGILCI